MSNESWQQVAGDEFDGCFVSDQGNVKTPNKVLSPWTLDSGLRAVKVRGKTFLLHLLVLQTFVGPRPEGATPRWLNGDPGDNRLVNLRWWREDEPEVLTRVNRCRNNHVYTSENTGTWGSGHRICLDCQKGVAAVTELPEVL